MKTKRIPAISLILAVIFVLSSCGAKKTPANVTSLSEETIPSSLPDSSESGNEDGSATVTVAETVSETHETNREDIESGGTVLTASPDETVPSTETVKETESETEKETVKKTSEETTVETTAEPVVLPSQNTLLFDNSNSGIYNYCPTIITAEDGTAYIYYCTNIKSYRVVDYTGCRKGIPDGNGGYDWGEERIVLSPTENRWDAMHTCDPSVIAGSFKYGGETYGYLMAYLGCTSTDNQDNKIGLAVSKTPDGEFIKVGEAPLIDFVHDNTSDVFQWGVGQPSLVSKDKSGKVWLFYTRGDKNGTATWVEEWDFSDLDNPKREKNAVKLPVKGLYDLSGNQDIINNADFLYDEKGNRFIAASDCHPNPGDEPNFISSNFRVTYFDYSAGFLNVKWNQLDEIGRDETGFPRNHNVGLVRDVYGHLPDGRILGVYYTVSETGSSSLWSYRIHGYYFDISKIFN